MRFSWLVLVAATLLVAVVATKTKRRFDGDFEFAEEVRNFLFHLNSSCSFFPYVWLMLRSYYWKLEIQMKAKSVSLVFCNTTRVM